MALSELQIQRSRTLLLFCRYGAPARYVRYRCVLISIYMNDEHTLDVCKLPFPTWAFYSTYMTVTSHCSEHRSGNSSRYASWLLIKSCMCLLACTCAEESAAQAWDRVAWVYRGDQEALNFPNMVQDYDSEVRNRMCTTVLSA